MPLSSGTSSSAVAAPNAAPTPLPSCRRRSKSSTCGRTASSRRRLTRRASRSALAATAERVAVNAATMSSVSAMTMSVDQVMRASPFCLSFVPM